MAAPMSRDERLRSRKYERWVQCSLGLTETKGYMDIYIEEKFKKFVDGTLGGTHFQFTFSALERCHLRDGPFVKYARFDYARKAWEYDQGKNKHKCHECKSMFDKIAKILTPGKDPAKHLCWKNCTTCGHLHWDVAKVFLPKGKENIKGAKEIDVPDMTHMLLKCDLFTSLSNINVDTLRESRNELYHSPDNLVPKSQHIKYFKHMVDLLGEAELDPDAGADTRIMLNEGVGKLEKLRDGEMGMDLFEEGQKALRRKQKVIHHDFHAMLTSGKVEPAEVETFLKLFEDLGQDIATLNKFSENAERTKIIKRESLKVVKEWKNDKEIIKTLLGNTNEEMKNMQQSCERKLEQYANAYTQKRNLIQASLNRVKTMHKEIQHSAEEMKTEINILLYFATSKLNELKCKLDIDTDVDKNDPDRGDISFVTGKLHKKLMRSKQCLDVLKQDALVIKHDFNEQIKMVIRNFENLNILQQNDVAYVEDIVVITVFTFAVIVSLLLRWFVM